MKNLQQIRESVEQEQMPVLDPCIIEHDKHHILMRAIERDPEELTLAERKMLINTVSHLLESKPQTQGFQGFVADQTIPTTILMKRTSLQVQPNGQRIAMYYSQTLNKFLAVPFGPGRNDMGAQPSMNEEAKNDTNTYKIAEPTILKTIGKIRRDKSAKYYERIGGAVGAAVGGLTNRTAIGTMGVAAGVAMASKNAVDKYKRKRSFKSTMNNLQESSRKLDRMLVIHEDNDTNLLRQLIESKRRELEEGLVDDAVGMVKSTAKKAGGAIGRGIKRLKKSVSGAGNAAKNATINAGEKIKKAADDADTNVERQSGGSSYERPSSSPLINTEPTPGRVSTSSRVTRDAVASKEWQRSMAESDTINQIGMVAEGFGSKVVHVGDESLIINSTVAKKLVDVFESLNKPNRKKMTKMMNEDVQSLKKVINFAIRQ